MLIAKRNFAAFLAILAYLAPWIGLPHHLCEIGHHDDCPARIACKHKPSPSED